MKTAPGALRRRRKPRPPDREITPRLVAFMLNPRRAVEIVALLGAAVVAASCAALVPCPAVQFSATIKTTGLHARIGANDGTSRIRGLAARRVSWEFYWTDGTAGSNDLVASLGGGSDASTDAVEAPEGDAVELAELAVPDGSWLELRLAADRSRRRYLDLEIDAPSSKSATTIIVGPPGAAGAHSKRILHAPKYRLLHPELVGDSLVPLRIAGLLLSTRVPSGDATYPVSQIREGEVQFFYLDRRAGSQVLGRGDVVHFDGLNAEIRALAIEGDVLTLRIFGTARDVRFGVGSAVSSIYPSLLDGLAAQPWLTPTLGTISGLLLAWFGVLVGSGFRPPSSPA